MLQVRLVEHSHCLLSERLTLMKDTVSQFAKKAKLSFDVYAGCYLCE